MIDQEFIQIRINAHTKIQQHKFRSTSWSPPLAEAYLKVQLWAAIKKTILQKRDMTECINNIQEKLKDPLALIPTHTTQLKEVNTQLTTAKSHYKAIQKQAPEMRNCRLWDQTHATGISGNKQASKEIKQLYILKLPDRNIAK